jgi:putative DNA primase/helicase
MENTMMEAALKYAEANIPVMLLHWICEDGACSCNKGQKCDSKGNKNSTTDTQQIVRWWTIKPNANIGIPTGEKSGW